MGRGESDLWQSGLFTASACALLVLGVWYFRPGVRRRLLPPQRCRAVPWSGFEVLAALFVVVILPFWPIVLHEFLTGIGFFTWLYGPELARSAAGASTVGLLGSPSGQGPLLAASAEFADDMHSKVRAIREQALWLPNLTFPLTVLSLVVFFRIASDTRPYQLGLSTYRAGRSALAGLVGWMCLTPFAYVVLWLATWLSSALFHVAPDEHSLTKLSHSSLSPLEWFLLVLSAVAAAPAVEELLFRGVVQPWLARRSWGGAAALGAAFLLALTFLWSAYRADGLAGAWKQLPPVVFVFALVPPFLVVWGQSRSPVAPAIYGTSLFWAMLHANVWPTPVPLFVLGLGLGYLAYRTQSLVAPLVLHALFNAVACVMLLYPQLAPAPAPTPEKGSPTTSAVHRLPPASTSTVVPGS